VREEIREIKAEIDTQEEQIKTASDEMRASEALVLESLEQRLTWLESQEKELTK
jgi:hypothetical protein